jgi:hypothetical protein
MSTFSRIAPPNLPTPQSDEYDARYFSRFLNILRLYFTQISAVQQINAAKLNFDLTTLPTQADLANLRMGDVYRDTAAGHVLKVKT